MYASLTGLIVALGPTTATLECAGVGYLCHCPSRTLGALTPGQHARLWVHLAVREDALTLYGFTQAEERDFFLSLTQVSGVGPKLGLSLLSTFNVAEIVQAISAGQPTHLARASGVGKKLAEKIIVELKDKLGTLPGLAALADGTRLGAVVQGPLADVVSALQNLGYSPKVAEAASLKAQEQWPGGSFDQLFKTALTHATGS